LMRKKCLGGRPFNSRGGGLLKRGSPGAVLLPHRQARKYILFVSKSSGSSRTPSVTERDRYGGKEAGLCKLDCRRGTVFN